MKRIGIFSGTFDPVHGGHIAFALGAAEEAKLDKIYFVPEAQPRRKSAVTHYAHRVAMLKLALRPYQKLDLMELPDKQFSVKQTLPRLRQKLDNSELHLLIGSDMLEYMNTENWPDSDVLLASTGLIVGVRSGMDNDTVQRFLGTMKARGIVITNQRPHASSRDIRSALLRGHTHDELLGSLKQYVSKNWLYTSVTAQVQS